jgi:hypothetical protein
MTLQLYHGRHIGVVCGRLLKIVMFIIGNRSYQVVSEVGLKVIKVCTCRFGDVVWAYWFALLSLAVTDNE